MSEAKDELKRMMHHTNKEQIYNPQNNTTKKLELDFLARQNLLAINQLKRKCQGCGSY